MKFNKEKIVPYIAYDVEIQVLNHKSDYVGIGKAKTNGFYSLGDNLHITYDGGSTGKSANECRLILRPLSDVKKVITIDGYSFDPEEALNDEFGDCETFYSFDGDKLIEDIYRTENAIHNQNIYPNPDYYPRFIANSLIEWGFDLDNLIKEGYAIDVNLL